MIKTISDRITLLTRFCQRRGINVVLDLSLSEHISGQCDYINKTIRYNEPSATEALNTLTHEIGHWLFFEKVGYLPQRLFPKTIREFMAEYFSYKLKKHRSITMEN